MKTTFIKVNDILEINTSKITIRDLSNRYIDKKGNMYGLKYNRKTRKVSITKIIRTPSKSAEYYHQLLINNKKNEANKNKSALTSLEKAGSAILETIAEERDSTFNIDEFLNKAVELMQTHKSRLSGISMNIKNSRVIKQSDRIDSTQLDDIFRNIDIDGVQRIDKILAMQKEIRSYPRSINFYLAKLDTKSVKLMEALDTDTRKMNFIYYYEMYHSIQHLYRTLFKILNDLNYFIEGKNPEEMKDISSNERQYFIDARTSVQNTIEEIEKILDNFKTLKSHLEDPNNF